MVMDQHLVVVMIFTCVTTAISAIVHMLTSPHITTLRVPTNTQGDKPATLPWVGPPMAPTSEWQNTRCFRWSSSDRDSSSHYLSYPSSILKTLKMIFLTKASLRSQATNSLVRWGIAEKAKKKVWNYWRRQVGPINTDLYSLHLWPK